MHRRDLLLFRTRAGSRVFELSCERLHMRYLDACRPSPAAAVPDSHWLGEPEPHVTTPSAPELFDGLRRDLAGVEILRVVGPEWLAHPGLKREVDALVAFVRAGGARVEFGAADVSADVSVEHA